MFLALGIDNVPRIIEDSLRTLCAWLCQLIYSWMSTLYSVFEDIGLIAYNDEFSMIYNKISMVIGVFMVFRVTFWLIEMLVNPDMITDKEKSASKIIQKVLISVLLLATTPTIFKYAYKIQNEIVGDKIINRLISSEGVKDTTETGRFLAAELFSNFYTYNKVVDGKGEEDDSCSIYANKENESGFYKQLLNEGKLSNLTNTCLTKSTADDDSHELKNGGEGYYIEFNGLFEVIVGAVVFWMILMYCISVGSRYVQLVFLQIIAPIPIMCYLTPGKDNMFSKWVKQCTTTYLDLFIRIAIISFVIELVNAVLSTENNIILVEATGTQGVLIRIFLVLGLLMFAKKAPELIQELLPKSLTKASGDFGLSLKKRTDNMLGGKFLYNTAKRAPGYVVGGFVGGAIGLNRGIEGGKGLGSRIVGGVTGAARGFATGSKKGNVFKNINEVKKNQAAHNNKLQQWRITAGKGENEPNTMGDYFSRTFASIKKDRGYESRGEEFKRAIDSSKSASSAFKDRKEQGIQKADEKRYVAKGLGFKESLTELRIAKDNAWTNLNNTNKDKLLLTDEGKEKLKIEATRRGLDFSTMSDIDKSKLADAVMSNLYKAWSDADQAYDDRKGKYGFLYNIKDSEKNESIVNDFKKINEFLGAYDETFGLTSGDNPVLKNKTKEFNLEKLRELLSVAENDVDPSDPNYDEELKKQQEAREQLEKYYEDFDMLKTLQGRVDTIASSKEHLRDKANDGFSGKH